MDAKDKAKQNANGYVKIVRDTKTTCESLKNQLSKDKTVVEQNWNGDGATAMCEALDAVCVEVDEVIKKLTAAIKAMNKDINTMYDNWPQEDITDGK